MKAWLIRIDQDIFERTVDYAMLYFRIIYYNLSLIIYNVPNILYKYKYFM
jgi:hypothetical protein